jgi:16S rRNA (cytidine1402-2'-O)-methyltransferase
VQGRLFIIGTPIGNLADISRRALDTLASLDILYCEDTRVSGKLLQHFAINVKTRALSDDHGGARWQEAVQEVLDGRKVGYVSDAGMPGISDPARRLTEAAWQAGVVPQVIPGPSALDSAIAACPFVQGRFCFAGFAARRAGEREQFLEDLRLSAEPTAFFESPLRVHALLDDLCARLEPARRLLIGRELTKMFEQLILFDASEWPEVKGRVPAKGEFTVVVEGAPEVKRVLSDDEVAQVFQRLLDRGFSRRDATNATAAALELTTNRVKQLTYAADKGERE